MVFRMGCIYRDEQQRLEEFCRLKYKIKILVNGGIVSETKERFVYNKHIQHTYAYTHVHTYAHRYTRTHTRTRTRTQSIIDIIEYT